jgi:hypothetical protein
MNMVLRRAALGAAGVPLLLGGLTACGGEEKAPTAVASSAAPLETGDAALPVLKVTDAVAGRFGAGKVQAAYRQMASLTVTASFQKSLVRTGTHQAGDFALVEKQMTQTTTKAWRAIVTKALAGDATAKAQVMTMSYYDLTTDEFTLAADGPLVTNQRVTKPSAAVAGSQLTLVLNHHGELRATDNKGEKVRYPIDKKVTYFLVPGSGDAWQIAGWTADYKSGTTIADA